MSEPEPAGPASTGTEITARLARIATPGDLLPADDSRPDRPIAPVSTAVCAFIGRTLKGPVGEPVRITSFGQFQQVFGGLWDLSPLSYAIEQFFENGGEDAIVARAVSGGRAPTLDLPCGDDVLVLDGRCPGSREYLRASIDYDSLPGGDPRTFNLVVQRVRSPDSELVEEQEIHRRLTVDPGSPRFVATVLDDSRLVRVHGPVPAVRPSLTPPRAPSTLAGYVACNGDGDDGEPLSDYDLIGSQSERTGLFALHGAGHFSFLCLPPLERERDVGMSALFIAARLCRERHAMLIVDPPRTWTDAGQAIDGMRRWPFHSADALMYFPRLLAQDRVRDRIDRFACSGAVAGLFARRDRVMPVWQADEGEAVPLPPSLVPAVALTEVERTILANYGVNTFGQSRGSLDQRLAPRSLAATVGATAEPRLLAGRRLALLVVASIEYGTRWVLYGTADAARRAQVQAQVLAMLEGLAAEGAFAPVPESCFAVCDERLNGPGAGRPGEFRLLYGYAPLRSGEYQAWLTTHRPAGSQTRAVSINRLVSGGRQVDVEVQSAILRGLTL